MKFLLSIKNNLTLMWNQFWNFANQGSKALKWVIIVVLVIGFLVIGWFFLLLWILVGLISQLFKFRLFTVIKSKDVDKDQSKFS